MKIKDEAFLLELAKDKSLPDDLRAPVIARITDKDFLEKTVFGEGSAKIRIAAVRGIKDKELLAKIRDTVPECRNAACDKLGHAWSFSHYTAHGNGGSDAVYVCDICGAEKKEPYEWSSADSV